MIDKRLLTDEVAVMLKRDENEWGKPNYHKGFTLKYVRFDRSVVSKFIKNGKTDNTTLYKQGVIFIYPKFCKVVIDSSWLEAKIIDDFGEYTVQGFKVNYFNGKLFSYEVEVI